MGQVHELGEHKASLNSSVRFTASTLYRSALIDLDIAESLLNLSHLAPVFAAWWYTDNKVFLYRIDEDGGFNSNARIHSKLTPTSFFDKKLVPKLVMECPFDGCYTYSYHEGSLSLERKPMI